MKKSLTVLISLSILCLSGYVYAHGDHHKHDDEHHHEHHQSEKALQASKGIFDNADVQDRTLADWMGTWQSVERYLLNGDLDVVLTAKAKEGNKTFTEYKEYYKKGYATDIEFIGIENDKIDFHKKDSIISCHYKYSGYKILTYTSGKKGVRYLFECQDVNSDAPKYIQFSDHIIEPTASEHFHLYMGNKSHEKLLEEMDNWPTYFPLSLNKDQIVHEMLAH